MNPIEAIIEAQKEYILAQGGNEPTRLFLPKMIAFDIAKLGRSQIGSIAEDIMRDGIGALNRLLGMEVILTDEENIRFA